MTAAGGTYHRVLVLCAHSDDQAIGPGGFLAKLAREGVEIRTYVASFGEQSHPHLQPKEIKSLRVLESKKADKILGGKGVLFLGLHEGKILQEYDGRKLHPRIVHHVQEFHPDLIITHASDDPHPDHRAVHRIALRLHRDAAWTSELFTFDIWNIVDLKWRTPKVVVDVTDTFRKKIDAIEAFKSQKVAIITLILPVYARALFAGWRRGVRYAERFAKVR